MVCCVATDTIRAETKLGTLYTHVWLTLQNIHTLRSIAARLTNRTCLTLPHVAVQVMPRVISVQETCKGAKCSEEGMGVTHCPAMYQKMAKKKKATR